MNEWGLNKVHYRSHLLSFFLSSIPPLPLPFHPLYKTKKQARNSFIPSLTKTALPPFILPFTPTQRPFPLSNTHQPAKNSNSTPPQNHQMIAGQDQKKRFAWMKWNEWMNGWKEPSRTDRSLDASSIYKSKKRNETSKWTRLNKHVRYVTLETRSCARKKWPAPILAMYFFFWGAE